MRKLRLGWADRHPDLDDPPQGLIVHIAVERPEGELRYIDVWESEGAWDRFSEERLHPSSTDCSPRCSAMISHRNPNDFPCPSCTCGSRDTADVPGDRHHRHL